MRAHARRVARRAEGGKERVRQPSGAAEGAAKREREEEAFAPAVRQHAERAVLVVPQRTSLAARGWLSSLLAGYTHSGGAVELRRAQLEAAVRP